MINGLTKAVLALAAPVGAVTAWLATPAFTGLAGVGKALIVGAGTTLGASIAAPVVALAAGVTLGVLGVLYGRKTGKAGFVLGASIGCLAGATGGAVEGYKFSKAAFLEVAPCKTSFNGPAEKAYNFSVTPQQAAKLKVNTPSL